VIAVTEFNCIIFVIIFSIEGVDKERLLECYQVIQQIVLGKFPLNKELALELAALMAQVGFTLFRLWLSIAQLVPNFSDLRTPKISIYIAMCNVYC